MCPTLENAVSMDGQYPRPSILCDDQAFLVRAKLCEPGLRLPMARKTRLGILTAGCTRGYRYCAIRGFMQVILVE
jgi:hypothetical protein